MNRLLLPGLAALVLAACTPPGPLDPDFGNAVRQNMVVQMVDPAAAYPAEVETSGARAAAAIDRYERGEAVRPPTTQIGSGALAARNQGGGR